MKEQKKHHAQEYQAIENLDEMFLLRLIILHLAIQS